MTLSPLNGHAGLPPYARTLGITTVIDLRTEAEVAKASLWRKASPDIKVINFPVDDGFLHDGIDIVGCDSAVPYCGTVWGIYL